MTVSIEKLTPEVQEFIKSELSKGEHRTVEEVLDTILLPVAKQQANQTTRRTSRKAGNGAGKVWMSPDFDEPLEELKP